ncbi:MAG TPA: tetratricopeptide repeat protein [Ktedonobacterales bacterium]
MEMESPAAGAPVDGGAPANNPTARIGQRIRRARLTRNYTQGDLARGDFSVSYVSAVERGQIRPSLGALERLSVKLRVPIAELLTDAHDAEIDAAASYTASYSAESEAVREEISARLREAQILSRQGRTDEAITVLKEVLGRANAPRDIAATRYNLAAAYLSLGRADDARAELEEALPIAERIGDRELQERCRNELGNAYYQLNKVLLALECYRGCYETIQKGIMRDPGFRLNVLSSLGNAYWYLGELDKAVEILKDAAELSNDVVNPERLGQIYWLLSSSYGAQGDAGRAKRYALQSIQSYEEVGNKRQASYVHSRLGRAYIHANQLEDAEAHLHVAHEMARKLDDAQGISESACSLSELHLRRKQFDEAEAEAREALSAAERRPDAIQRAEAMLAMGEALEAHGKRRDAETHMRNALKALEGGESRQPLAKAYARVSTFYENRQDAAKALEYMRKAWSTAGHDRV